MTRLFKNDYSELADERIIEAIKKHLNEQHKAYGLDEHSENAKGYIRKTFDVPNADIHFLAGGTQTNMVTISYFLKPYEAVIACDTGHINVHETGAVEASGHKIITCKNKDGKIKPEDIEHQMKLHTDEHVVKPKMVYISNATESGTIYTKKELEDIRRICDTYSLYLFIDGARLGSALTSKACDYTKEFFGNITDIFYIGGTKNGLLIGEALVIKNKELSECFRYHIKNRGAMLAKGFLIGIEFEEAFKDGLYFELAKQSNETSEYIKEELKKANIVFDSDSPTNQQFIILPNEKADKVIKEFGCELWEKREKEKVIRIVTSFSTKKEDCDEIINFIKEL